METCLICSSSVITTPDIKVEPDLDQVCDDDCQSVIKFLLATLLEIPQNEVAVYLKEKLINQQLNTLYCESCTKLIYSAKQLYTEILELTQKFRKVQKQIVTQISNYDHLHPPGGTPISTSSHIGILEFCRNFLNKHDFNGFGYPFVVNDIPPPVDVEKVKEEPLSEDEHDLMDSSEVHDDDQEYLQDSDDASTADDEESENESDSDFEPPSPPPKKPAKKFPIKKPSSSSPQKGNRKSPPPTTSKSRSPKKKPIPPKKQSKFDRLYPNYPKRIRDPITKQFHCLEPSCSKTCLRKARLEAHIIGQHFQDNFYKCSEDPTCGKSFSNPEAYQDHVSWHKGIPRWKCQEKVTTPGGETEQCSEAFYGRRILNRHIQKVHFTEKPFICEICGQIFSCQDYLVTHKYMKHTEKGKEIPPPPQICEKCGKSYSCKANLNLHISRDHEKSVGKFPCKFCEMKFHLNNDLKVHMFRKHNFSMDGFKIKKKVKGQGGGSGSCSDPRYKFQCDVKRCKMKFAREEKYRKHMEEKHGEGKEEVYEFTCKFCGKGFHVKWKLEYHEEAHENKESKPFSCEICGRKFARIPYLKIHRRNIHKIPMEKQRKI